MTTDRETTIRRLAMRSMRRGIKEMDLILSDFADRRLQDLSDTELVCYERLLAEPDLEIYGWILGQAAPPDHYADLMAEISAGAKGLVAPGSTTDS